MNFISKTFFYPAVMLALILASSRTAGAVPEAPDKKELAAKTAKVLMPFTANDGQMDGKVKYYAATLGGTLLITDEGELVYSFVKGKDRKAGRGVFDNGKTERTAKKDLHVEGVILKEVLLGSVLREIKGEKETGTKVNYLRGRDPESWKRAVRTYETVDMGEVYTGIELKLKAYGNNVEKLFYVKPDGKADDIRIKLTGGKGIKVNDKGELEVETGLGLVRYTKPVAYQEIDGRRVEVTASYNIGRDDYGFKLGDYDRTRELIIDPLLASTFLGGNSEVYAIKTDASGNVYVTGETGLLPTTGGPYDVSYNGYGDVFVAKFNPSLTTLLAATYLGGSDEDIAYTMDLDGYGNVYLAGQTCSTDFPVTPGAYDTRNSDCSAFVSRLDGLLTGLAASTLVGGSFDDVASSIALDGSGNVYIYGRTNSPDFPVTAGAYDTDCGSDGACNMDYVMDYDGMKWVFYYDAFVSKFNPALTTLLSSTFLGGSGDENIEYVTMISPGMTTEFFLSPPLSSLAIDKAGNVFVSGYTRSPDFPSTNGSYDSSCGTDGTCNARFDGSLAMDAFVAKFNSGLTDLQAATFLGGSDYDLALSVSSDNAGNVFVAGLTKSEDFPSTAGAYGPSLKGQTDAFVSKFDNALKDLLASTFFGGRYDDSALTIKTDNNGNVYVAGETFSPDLPVGTDSFDTTFNGGMYNGDGFIAKMDGTLSGLLAATYLGGRADVGGGVAVVGMRGEGIVAQALDAAGNLYVTGLTYSSDFPVTPGAHDTQSGIPDIFISKFDPGLSMSAPLPPYQLIAKATSSASIALSWREIAVNETGFRIERKQGDCRSTNAYAQIGSTGQNITTFINSGLSPGTTYAYRVRAYNNAGNSLYPGCVSAVTAAAGTPKAPTALKAVSISSDKISLVWNDNSIDETGFRIFRRAGAGAWSLLKTVGSNIRSFGDTAAAGNNVTKYSYFLQACNSAGCSPATSEAAVPYPPSGLYAYMRTDEGGNYLSELHWTDNSQDETGFEIQRKNGTCTSTNPWTILTQTGPNPYEYSDEVISGSTHAYRIRAFKRSSAAPFAYGFSTFTGCVSMSIP